MFNILKSLFCRCFLIGDAGTPRIFQVLRVFPLSSVLTSEPGAGGWQHRHVCFVFDFHQSRPPQQKQVPSGSMPIAESFGFRGVARGGFGVRCGDDGSGRSSSGSTLPTKLGKIDRGTRITLPGGNVSPRMVKALRSRTRIRFFMSLH